MVRALYFAIALEVFLGGGGRLLEIGPLTVRMLLFAVAVGVSCWLALHHEEQSRPMRMGVALVLLFLAVHLPPSILGLLRGADARDVFADVQPILYWLIAPFFAFALQRTEVVRTTATIVWICGVMLACGYLALLAAVHFWAADPLLLYEMLNATGEFQFRIGGFIVYKAFLYLGIGIVFLVAIRPRGYAWMVAVVVFALVMTLTRGFLLSTGLAVGLMLLVERRSAMGVAALLVALAGAWLVWVHAPEALEGLAGQREISNAIRQEDVRFIVDEMSSGALLVGHGFGAPVLERLNIENSFLWILWKAGLPGLLFWLLPLALCWRGYRAIPAGSADAPLGAAYFYSVLLVYAQTATNPYLNNPIGLAFVLISLFALRRLGEQSRPAATSDAAGKALGAA